MIKSIIRITEIEKYSKYIFYTAVYPSRLYSVGFSISIHVQNKKYVNFVSISRLTGKYAAQHF